VWRVSLFLFLDLNFFGWFLFSCVFFIIIISAFHSSHVLGIAGNYHALVYSAALKESSPVSHQLALVTAGTRGVASLVSGQIETMLLRSGLTQDHQGPFPLHDTAQLLGHVQWVAVGAAADVEEVRPLLQERLNAPSHVFGTSGDATVFARLCNATHGMAGMELPFQLQLLSLERYSSTYDSFFSLLCIVAAAVVVVVVVLVVVVVVVVLVVVVVVVVVFVVVDFESVGPFLLLVRAPNRCYYACGTCTNPMRRAISACLSRWTLRQCLTHVRGRHGSSNRSNASR
jgi:hypothetical protein